MRVIVSDRAEADIEAIADFIAENNPARAASFARELLSACRDLTERPFRFAALRNFEHRGYRRRVHGRYLVVYRVEDDDVIIVRVLPSSMDVDSELDQA